MNDSPIADGDGGVENQQTITLSLTEPGTELDKGMDNGIEIDSQFICCGKTFKTGVD